MLKRKNVLALLLSFSLVASLMPGNMITATAMENSGADLGEESVETGAYTQWKNTAITYPEKGQLVAAGTFGVEFNSLSGAIKYEVYVDGKLVKTFEGEEAKAATYEAEAYSVGVTKHTTHVVATLENGGKVTSNIRNFYISKKGTGFWMEDAGLMEEMNLSWYYNWSPYEKEDAPRQVEFVPMIWGDYEARSQEANWLKAGNYKNYRYLLTFNEPDYPDQANMTPQRAVTLWDEFEKIREEGVKVSSPAVAIPTVYYGDTNNDYGTVGGWYGKYEELMVVNDYHDDFTAVHFYFDYPGDWILGTLEEIHEKTGKPLWITEWGVGVWTTNWTYWTGGPDEGNENRQLIVDFVETILPQLDEIDYIERYAWFSFDGSNTEQFGNGAGGLIFAGEDDPLKGELTAVGKAYRDYGNPEGWDPDVVPEDTVVSFEWAEDGSSCKYIITNPTDSTQNRTYPCTIKSEVKKAATCKEMGTTVYTASFTNRTNCKFTDVKEIADVPVDAANHAGETEVRNAKAATGVAEGYTGDTYCKGCNTKLASGTVIPVITGNPDSSGNTTAPGGTTQPGGGTTQPGGGTTQPGGTSQDNLPEEEYETMEDTKQTITSADTDKGDVEGSAFATLRLKAVGKKKSVKLTWKKVKDADGYILYGAQCGNALEEIKTFEGASKVKYTHKKLKKGKYYKYMVVAYKNIDGQKYIIASSKSAHAVTNGGKYANPTKVSVKASKMTIRKGKKKTIKASYTIPKDKKAKVHIAKFRYESDNLEVATVTKKGSVKGVKKGTANIYVYAQNGIYKKVKITVK